LTATKKPKAHLSLATRVFEVKQAARRHLIVDYLGGYED
jgi:hypothetical protein